MRVSGPYLLLKLTGSASLKKVGVESVNRRVAASNPARGANLFHPFPQHSAWIYRSRRSTKRYHRRVGRFGPMFIGAVLHAGFRTSFIAAVTSDKALRSASGAFLPSARMPAKVRDGENDGIVGIDDEDTPKGDRWRMARRSCNHRLLGCRYCHGKRFVHRRAPR